jgi:hypothetical protein
MKSGIKIVSNKILVKLEDIDEKRRCTTYFGYLYDTTKLVRKRKISWPYARRFEMSCLREFWQILSKLSTEAC